MHRSEHLLEKPPASASASGWPWKGRLLRHLSLPPGSPNLRLASRARCLASPTAPAPTTHDTQNLVPLLASSSCVCSSPKQRLCGRPRPAKEQSHIVQSKQLWYQLEQKRNHAPRPQSPNPAGQSRVKRLKAARQQNMPLSASRAFIKGSFYVATPSAAPPGTLLPTSFEKPEYSLSLLADGVCSR